MIHIIIWKNLIENNTKQRLNLRQTILLKFTWLTFLSSSISGVGWVRWPALGQAGVDLHLQGGQLRTLPPRGEPRPRTQILRTIRTATLWNTAPGHGKKIMETVKCAWYYFLTFQTFKPLVDAVGLYKSSAKHCRQPVEFLGDLKLDFQVKIVRSLSCWWHEAKQSKSFSRITTSWKRSDPGTHRRRASIAMQPRKRRLKNGRSCRKESRLTFFYHIIRVNQWLILMVD